MQNMQSLGFSLTTISKTICGEEPLFFISCQSETSV